MVTLVEHILGLVSLRLFIALVGVDWNLIGVVFHIDVPHCGLIPALTH